MKSCLGLFFIVMVLTLVLAGGGLIWYLSHSAEFSRKDAAPARAIPVPGKR
ncbi:MAG: hypothetical protein Q8Q59_12165 [Luteolibacter sp.]|jgi:hypothetical protein|nr:hypothetical protein [Luteolibacter sp.]